MMATLRISVRFMESSRTSFPRDAYYRQRPRSENRQTPQRQRDLAAPRRSFFEETPVDLYLIRHAEALALGERGVTDDSERPLTPIGEQQSAAVGKMFQRRGIVLDRLIASPYVRAQQTANILLRHLQPAPELETTDALVPNAKP